MNKKDPLPPDTQVVEVGIGEGFVRAISHCIIKKKKKVFNAPLLFLWFSSLLFLCLPD